MARAKSRAPLSIWWWHLSLASKSVAFRRHFDIYNQDLPVPIPHCVIRSSRGCDCSHSEPSLCIADAGAKFRSLGKKISLFRKRNSRVSARQRRHQPDMLTPQLDRILHRKLRHGKNISSPALVQGGGGTIKRTAHAKVLAEKSQP